MESSDESDDEADGTSNTNMVLNSTEGIRWDIRSIFKDILVKTLESVVSI